VKNMRRKESIIILLLLASTKIFLTTFAASLAAETVEDKVDVLVVVCTAV
jgi:short-subunit dehydrogenase